VRRGESGERREWRGENREERAERREQRGERREERGETEGIHEIKSVRILYEKRSIYEGVIC